MINFWKKPAAATHNRRKHLRYPVDAAAMAGHASSVAKPLPTMGQLFKLARHAIINAAELLDDAKLLLGHERWPRAHALAVLALEELGKVGICLGALSYEEAQAEQFWTDFRHHSTKLLHAGAAVQILGPVAASSTFEAVVDQAKMEAGHEHAQKLRGLYVDFATSSSGVRLPNDIGEGSARRAVDRVGALLDVLGPAWMSEEIVQRLEELDRHGDELQELFAQARQLVRIDAAAAVAIGRSALQGELPLSPTDHNEPAE